MWGLFVSETKFDRSMSQVVRGLKDKTTILPKTCKEVRKKAFRGTPLISIVLNEGLEVLKNVFYGCKKLKTIYVEESCNVSLCDLEVPDSVKIGPPLETMIGNARAWALRDCRQVVIPDGAEKVGNHCFWGTDVERVEIPASVLEIGADAFHGCEKLREVVFVPGSRLEKIGQNCFYNTRIERIVVPKGVTEIQEHTFC